jgi:hypothetical protein
MGEEKEISISISRETEWIRRTRDERKIQREQKEQKEKKGKDSIIHENENFFKFF